jgi:hypothetical protein
MDGKKIKVEVTESSLTVKDEKRRSRRTTTCRSGAE